MTTEAKGKPKRRPGAAPVFLFSLALFGLLLGLVAYRAGSETKAAPVAQAAPERKLVIRRVVTTVVPAAGPTPGAEVNTGAAPAVEAAPVETAPVEPAPVTTSSS